MTVARQFFLFWCAATITGFSCKPDVQLPTPINVTYRWNDPFNVNVSWSWEKPDHLPDNCTIKYYMLEENKIVSCTSKSEICHSKMTYFTEDKPSDHWNISIRAVQDKPCNDWKDSNFVNISIKTIRPRAELVKDFDCSLESNRIRCSWTPLTQPVKLNISYRTSKENDKIKACIGANSHEGNICYLNISTLKTDIYVLVEAETGLSTFKPKFVTPLPEIEIAENGSSLNWTVPHPGPAVGDCNLKYNICITECSRDKPCLSYYENSGLISYDKNCEYKIEYSIETHKYCLPVTSPSKVKFYGKNRSPDETLMVVAIVVPIILSACVILSCYCFRRHRKIICPTIPDPSTIFKEMMMSGNKEPKATPENLYAPVPEPTEYVTLVTDNSVVQQTA